MKNQRLTDIGIEAENFLLQKSKNCGKTSQWTINLAIFNPDKFIQNHYKVNNYCLRFRSRSAPPPPPPHPLLLIMTGTNALHFLIHVLLNPSANRSTVKLKVFYFRSLSFVLICQKLGQGEGASGFGTVLNIMRSGDWTSSQFSTHFFKYLPPVPNSQAASPPSVSGVELFIDKVI